MVWPAYPKRTTISKCYLAVKQQKITMDDLEAKNKYVHALVVGRMKSELAAEKLKCANLRCQKAVAWHKRRIIMLVKQKRRMQWTMRWLKTQKSEQQSKMRSKTCWLATQKSKMQSKVAALAATNARLQKLVSDQNKMLGTPNKRSRYANNQCCLQDDQPKSHGCCVGLRLCHEVRHARAHKLRG